jgi:hypothetical protein
MRLMYAVATFLQAQNNGINEVICATATLQAGFNERAVLLLEVHMDCLALTAACHKHHK